MTPPFLTPPAGGVVGDGVSVQTVGAAGGVEGEVEGEAGEGER